MKTKGPNLSKDVEEDPQKWQDSLRSWIGRIHFVKMHTRPKALYRFRAMAIKVSSASFREGEQTPCAGYGSAKVNEQSLAERTRLESWLCVTSNRVTKPE